MVMFILGVLTGSQNLRVRFVILRIVCVVGQGPHDFLRDATSSSCNDILSMCAFLFCGFPMWNCSLTLL